MLANPFTANAFNVNKYNLIGNGYKQLFLMVLLIMLCLKDVHIVQ